MQEGEKEAIKIHLSSLRQIIDSKLDVLSTVSGLVATLLIVATFNEKLLPITFLLKIILVILLAIMPTSLIFKMLNLHLGENETLKSIYKITGINFAEFKKEKNKNHNFLFNIFIEMLGWSSYIILAIFTILIIVIIFMIL